MTKAEWLEIGYEKHLIDLEVYEEVPFYVAFRQWFCMKMQLVRGSTIDRIEYTYNKYYKDSAFSEMCISKITETDIINFINMCFARNPTIDYKEYLRLFQIVNNVLVYMRDLRVGGVSFYEWDKIKRYIPIDKLTKNSKIEYAVNDKHIQIFIDNVVNHNIYPDKRNGSLCLCMNFYLGLRIGELSALTFDDFDFDRNVVKIYKEQSRAYNRTEDGARIGTMVYRVVDCCKTIYSVREIPILPEVRHIYDMIKRNHVEKGYDCKYLAYDGVDCVLYNSLEKTMRKLCLLNDIPYINTHLIRKTFVTKLHFSGVPTRVISDLVGHSEIGTTENSYILNYNNNYQALHDYMRNGLNYFEH